MLVWVPIPISKFPFWPQPQIEPLFFNAILNQFLLETFDQSLSSPTWIGWFLLITVPSPKPPW